MPHHDLESFYWVMVWILLRHSAHNHVDGASACTEPFDQASDGLAGKVKQAWIFQFKEPLEIPSNKPLTDLMKQLRKVFGEYHRMRNNHPGHEMFAQSLDIAIKSSEWPSSDCAIFYTRPNEGDTDNGIVYARISPPTPGPGRLSERTASSNVHENITPAEDPAEVSTAAAQLSELAGSDSDGFEGGELPALVPSRKRRSSFDDDEEHVRKKSRSSRQ
ncbi:hypothetical protein BDQ17DRAFT_1365002 [Cyathus striatus]|nr:hypothetical protein BDQ17DRAFT_1365002 [Cyathus striatus]